MCQVRRGEGQLEGRNDDPHMVPKDGVTSTGQRAAWSMLLTQAEAQKSG